MRYFKTFSYFMLTICVHFLKCEDVKYQLCPMTPSHKCNILNVGLNPCPEAVDDQPCNLYRGSNVTWLFNLKPEFSAQHLTFQSYSGLFGVIDVPYPGQDREACKYTSCPVQSAKNFTIKYPTEVKTSYPSGSFNVKWRIWNEENAECCFIVQIILV